MRPRKTIKEVAHFVRKKSAPLLEAEPCELALGIAKMQCRIRALCRVFALRIPDIGLDYLYWLFCA